MLICFTLHVMSIQCVPDTTAMLAFSLSCFCQTHREGYELNQIGSWETKNITTYIFLDSRDNVELLFPSGSWTRATATS